MSARPPRHRSPSPAVPAAAPDDAPRPFVPLAIVGAGAMFPGAADLRAFWTAVREGRDGIGPVPEGHWRREDWFDPDPKAPDRTYADRGGFLPPVDFAPLEYGIAPAALDATDSAQLFGLMVARRALEDAGLAPGSPRLDRERTSVILGVTGTLQLVIPLGARLGHPHWRRALREAGVPDDVADDVVARIGDAYVPWREDSFPGLLGNVVAGRIANRLDLRGTNCVVDAACASSLGALHLAAMELASGRADVVVSGGVDTFNDVFMFMCFSKTPALSPTGDARPFDAGADGTILGEGVGVVVLKRLADAERDGDRIYAVVRGVGASSDGKGEAIYAPTADGQMRCLRAAYAAAGVRPDTVDLVEAHGTGTRVGDAIELDALTRVYREAGPAGNWCALGSVKSQVGHTKAAAGAAGLLKAAMALHHRVLPPTIKVRRPLPALADGSTPFHLNAVKRPWVARDGRPRRAAVSAFGFGGSNFHCVLEEYPATAPAPDWDGTVEILPLGAATPEDLARAAGDAAAAPAEGWIEWRRRAHAARAAFDPASPYRLVAVLEEGRADPSRALAAAAALLRESPARTSWSTPDGVHFGSGAAPGRLAFLFPGQGAQYAGMLRDMTCRFPEALDALDGAGRAFTEAYPAATRRLVDFVHPPAAFDDESRERAEAELRATQVAQPALGAACVGALRVLARFGVRPGAAAGHSYGEIPALHAAGRIDEGAVHRLSAARGRLMADGRGDLGGMAAVQAPLADVEAAVREEGLDLVVANRNAPAQAVVSGPAAAIDAALAAFERRGVRARRLPVGAAFHGPLVAHASAPMAAALEREDVRPGSVPVWSNTTGAPWPGAATEVRTLLARQLAEPVEFVRMIEAMHADGVRTFLEVGPGARLTALVDSILGERAHAAFSVDASSGRRPGPADLAHALARLAALGHAVDLRPWEEGNAPPPPPPANRWTVRLTGAPYRRPVPPRPPRVPLAPETAPLPDRTAADARPESRAAAAPPGPARGAVAPAPPPIPATGAAGAAAALDLARENFEALRRLHEETAHLHRLFLEGQDRARAAMEALLARQMDLVAGGAVAAAPPPSGAAAAAPAADSTGTPIASVPAPAPIPVPAAPAPPVAAPALAAPPPAPVAAPVAVAAPAVSAAPVPAASASSDVARALLAAVAEKTGYPEEMLDLGMGLDADLGIDSIKRVEILAALQDRLPGLPAVKPDRMGSLRTLGDIVGLLAGEASPAPAAPTPSGAAAVGSPVPAAPAAPAVVVPPAAPAPSAPAPAADRAAVADLLLAAVADRTGYPREMLDLSMSLDADLGIDSIKRVEILSTLQERLPHLPAVRPERMGALRTLADIVDVLLPPPHPDRAPPPPPAPPPPAAPAPPPPATAVPAGTGAGEAAASAPDGGGLPGPSEWRYVVGAVPLRRGAPAETWSLPEGAEVWVTEDGAGLAAALAEALRAAGLDPRVVPPGAPPAGTLPERLGGLLLLAPAEADARALAAAFALVRAAAPSLRAAGVRGGAVLASVARMDGRFGLSPAGPGPGATGGGLGGLVKSARHEWPEVRCRALDLAASLDSRAAAVAVMDHLFRDGPVEVGVDGAGAWTPETRPAAPPAGEPVDPVLRPGDLVIVAGGARGVTAEVAVALAGRFRPAVVLLGRSPVPGDEEPWLRDLPDEGAVKRALVERAGSKPSPRDIEAAWRAIAAAREIRSTLVRIRGAGSPAEYRSVDCRDAAAVAAAVDAARRAHGRPVAGIVHGAGVIADALLETKTPEQVDRVLGTKIDGLRALLAAAGSDDLRLLLVFSSTTARFGRRGQSDYAAANEALTRMALAEAARRPRCRVRAMEYGPWDGGMVTPSLARVFEAEGVARIPLREGALLTAAEVAAPATAEDGVEIVILPGGPPAGGPPPAPSAAPMEDAFRRRVDTAGHPVLRSHVLDGRPVLPLALMVEWVAHGALHGNPGLHFHGVEDMRVLKGVVLDDDGAAELRVRAGRARRRGEDRVVPVEIRGRTRGGRDLLHARAAVVLGAAPPAPGVASPPPPLPPADVDPARAYGEILFHGPDLQGIEAVEGLGEAGVAVRVRRAPPPAAWIRQPLRGSWLADPLVLDAAFQAMILWSDGVRGAGSLPTGFARYRQFRRSFPSAGVRVVARITAAREHVAVADVDFLDPEGGLVARLEASECVLDASLRAAFRRRTIEV